MSARFASIIAVLAVALTPGVAAAASNRTFVASTGSDAGTCSRSQPCRSFSYAVSQTVPNGEVLVLDSAGYGALTITESITISNPSGVEAAISTAAGGTAITINASKPIDVTLRGLTLLGLGTASTGITVTSSIPSTATSAGSVNIIDCMVKDFTGDGISILPSRVINGPNPVTTLMSATLVNTTLLNNGQSGLYVSPDGLYLRMTASNLFSSTNGAGVNLAGTTGLTEFVMVNSLLTHNRTGFTTAGSTYATMKNSTVRSGTLSPRDVVNGSDLTLVNNNHMMNVVNNGSIRSDGTNLIGSTTGNAFSSLALK